VQSEDTPKFIVFQDVASGEYRWRLRSATSETLAHSEVEYAEKEACEQEVHRLREDRYPGAAVRDLTVGRFEI
jgi:uncharacterized protein YegP (UPF0339 family)